MNRLITAFALMFLSLFSLCSRTATPSGGMQVAGVAQFPEPTATAVPAATPTLAPTPTPTMQPTLTPTSTRTPTLAPSPRPTQTATRVPLTIDPLLVPRVPNAIARLRKCAPDAAKYIDDYVTRFEVIEGTVSRYKDKAIRVATSVVAFGDDLLLVCTIGHESRHAWQDFDGPVTLWVDAIESERDANQFTLTVFDRCPDPSSPSSTYLRSLIERNIANPPIY